MSFVIVFCLVECVREYKSLSSWKYHPSVSQVFMFIIIIVSFYYSWIHGLCVCFYNRVTSSSETSSISYWLTSNPIESVLVAMEVPVFNVYKLFMLLYVLIDNVQSAAVWLYCFSGSFFIFVWIFLFVCLFYGLGNKIKKYI